MDLGSPSLVRDSVTVVKGSPTVFEIMESYRSPHPGKVTTVIATENGHFEDVGFLQRIGMFHCYVYRSVYVHQWD